MSGAIAYLAYQDGKDVLCVIGEPSHQDGTFQLFEIAPHVVARLTAEGGLRMWREFGINGGTPGWAAKLGIHPGPVMVADGLDNLAPGSINYLKR